QLVVSYGVTAFVTIFLVVITAIIAALSAGDIVRDDARALLINQYNESLRESGQLTSQIFTQRLDNIQSSCSLLVEVVRDRIVGYPEDFADDKYVPFTDQDTGEAKYPLRTKLLPRDWQVVSNWNEDNLNEHAQERARLSEDLIGFMSTENAFFFFQGNCNPEDTPGMPGYYAFCDDKYNNATLGGAINPTDTLAPLEQKAADISVFMKAIWEAEPSAMAVSVYFFNSGAGAVVQFPSYVGDSESSYVSEGCEWMREINIYTDKPYGTEEEIARCEIPDTPVPLRLYNPMERAFCADQALHPGEVRISGPSLDANWGTWRLTVGQAVFDRRTGHFIACTALDMSLEMATEMLDSISFDNRTELAVTRVDGIVVAGAGISSNDTEPLHIDETGFMNEETFDQLTADLYVSNSYLEIEERKLFSVYTSPPPPPEYDPDFVPDFLIFTAVHVEEITAVVTEIEEEIESDVNTLIVTAVIFGLVGFLALLGFVFVVAQLLTRPLVWMEDTAWQIVNHSDERVGKSLIVVQDYKNEAKCAPKTEVTELVNEFESMITGFSGKGASTVASWSENEIRNQVTWHEDVFGELYNVDVSDENKVKVQKHLIAQSVSRRMSKKRSSRFDPGHFAKIVEEDAEFRSAEMGMPEAIEGEAERQSAVFGMSSMQSTGEPSLQVRSSAFSSRRSVSRLPFANSEAVDASARMHPGPHLAVEADDSGGDVKGSVRMSRSAVFWWILLWIIIPILLCIIAISFVVALRLDYTFPSWIDTARVSSFDVEYETLVSLTYLRAKFAEQSIPQAIRDLYVLTRTSGWLIFGGIDRSDGFPEIEMQSAEDCKDYTAKEVCPYEANKFRTPCDCAWNDPWGRECYESQSDPRYLQQMAWVSQQRDYDPLTGDRNESISFPNLDYSAVTTSWWIDPDEMPGSDKGSDAAGYDTAYDRLRVISAVSTISMPLYNYFQTLKDAESPSMGDSYVSFEADGGYIAYSGCNYDFARYASFESNEINGAFLINEELCPEGKFGYDPRCRAWYDTAKREALSHGHSVHVTAPYKFATVDTVGNTAVSPLVDPTTGEFVGNTLVDFSTTEMYEILDDSDADIFAVIISSVGPDAFELVSHSFNTEATPETAYDVVLPYNSKNSTAEAEFKTILDQMNSGGRGSGSLIRIDKNGVEETLYYSFAPIVFREVTPVMPSDFSRGAIAKEGVLYSLIMAKTEDELFAEFVAVSEQIQEQLKRTNIIYLVVTAIITLLCMFFTARPIINLLQIVKRVNEGRIDDALPPLNGGSREVHQVYTSFAKLYKMLQVSNTSFFSGNLDLALHTAGDAFKLFQKIGDDKAIAIVSNNLGNTLFALALDRRKPSACLSSDDGECCVKAALDFYDKAVDSGTRDFNGVDSDAEKCEFAQQLGDRHFNRALCLLQTSDDPCAPENAKEQAFADLHLAKQYDQGVKEYMLASRTLLDHSDVIFERSVRRLYGLSQLAKIDSDVWQVWDIYDLVDHSDLMLQAAWNQPDAPLFRTMNRVGRLQQLEGATASVEFSSGNFKDGALLSTRMLVEDEYIIESAFVEAADCLLRYSRDADQAKAFSPVTLSRLKQELRQMRKTAKKGTMAQALGRSYIFCFELSGHWNSTDALHDLQFECLTFYEENCNLADSFGVVSYDPQDGKVRSLKPTQRSVNDNAQRDAIVAATTGVACSRFAPALQEAVKMAIDAATSTASDVYLIYISDGQAWNKEIFEPLRGKIAKASRHRSASIDVLALGLEVQNTEFEQGCKDLCLATRSRDSQYIATGMDSMEEAFDSVDSLINAGVSFDRNRFQHGLTMEKF
ncbi:MAG: hypothetical protein SGILL_003738, partial [Bacillariaceae sp.]